MSKIKFVDTGPGENQVNLGALPDSQGDLRAAITKGEQSFNGVKIFKEIVGSPSSESDIFSAADDELVTYEQLAAYKDRIENQVIESGVQFAIGDASMNIDDVGGTVTFNPPVVERPVIGKIVYRGSTSRGRTFVHVFFLELVLKYHGENISFLTPTLLRIYTSPEPPTPEPPSSGGGGGGNTHVPKECPPVTIRVLSQGVVAVPGKVLWSRRDGEYIVICYRPNSC